MSSHSKSMAPEGEEENEEEKVVKLKFLLYDGSHIGPIQFSAASTIEMLKDRIIAEWPQDKNVIPKMANDVKLITAGKILEKDKNIGECRVPFSGPSEGVIIMHVVVQPSLVKTEIEEMADDVRALITGSIPVERQLVEMLESFRVEMRQRLTEMQQQLMYICEAVDDLQQQLEPPSDPSS